MLRYLLSLSLLGLSVASVLPQEAIISNNLYCDCNGPHIKTNVSAYDDYICGDKRLGPKVLPKKLPLGTYVASYDRFGGQSPNDFLADWWDEREGWKYPKNNGFLLDAYGKPIKANFLVTKGMIVDRFGHAGGKHIFQNLRKTFKPDTHRTFYFSRQRSFRPEGS